MLGTPERFSGKWGRSAPPALVICGICKRKGQGKGYTLQLPRRESVQISCSALLVWLHYLQGNQSTHKSAVFALVHPEITGSAFPLCIEILMICPLHPSLGGVGTIGVQIINGHTPPY